MRAFVYHYCSSPLYYSGFVLFGCGFRGDPIIAHEVVYVLRDMRFWEGCYMDLVPGDVLEDVPLRYLFFHRVRVQDGNVHCSESTFHCNQSLS